MIFKAFSYQKTKIWHFDMPAMSMNGNLRMP